MNEHIDTIRGWLAKCSLEPLEATDPAYVPFDERGVRGDDGSCIDQVFRTIRYAEVGTTTCQLFTGFPGSGKTTELRRLQRNLEKVEGNWTHVVLIDAENYVDRYTPLTITDVLRMLAWHLDKEATEVEGGTWNVRGSYAERLWRWLQADKDIKEIGFGGYGVSLMAEIKANPAFREKAEAVLSLRFQEFAREAHEVIKASVARIRRKTGFERVVVIVDGLEKLTAVRTEDRDRVEQAAEAVFGSHADWLHIDCHVVYTVPLWLRYRMTGLGSRYDSEVLTLPMVKIMVKILGRSAGDTWVSNPMGVTALLDMISQRISPIERAFGEDWKERLAPLIAASGGYPRDVLRLVRDAIKRAPSFPVPPTVIERVINVLAEEYHNALLSADLEVLRYIGTQRALPPGITQLRAAAWLFDHYLVLTYRNGSEWCDVHPLVRRSRLFPPPETPAS